MQPLDVSVTLLLPNPIHNFVSADLHFLLLIGLNEVLVVCVDLPIGLTLHHAVLNLSCFAWVVH